MYRRTIKLSQVNICGMSNHSQIALNKFINITNPYVLCINETKKDMTSDKFNNYTVVSAINEINSQGNAMLIHSSLPYLRIYDLETIHFDSIWIVTVLNGNKVVIRDYLKMSLRILALSETIMASFCAIQYPFRENFAKLFSKAGILKETISMTGNQLLITLYLSYGMNLTVILVWSN